MKKYTCPACGNTDGAEMRASQQCWVYLSVGEYEPGTHTLEDAELTEDYFGPVHLLCSLCSAEWKQAEIRMED